MSELRDAVLAWVRTPWGGVAAVGVVVVAVWVAGRVAETVLTRRGRVGAALGVGLAARGLALVLAVRAVPRLLGVDLPLVGELELGDVATAMALAAVGGLALWRLAAWAEHAGTAQGQPHASMVVGKVIRYGGAVVLALLVAETLGWDLTALLATAGVVGVAVGFASQTSLSNVIAGVFLLVDRPFEVGDTVEVGGHEGIVLEITLLSTRIRTFDNLVVRWPNEVVLKERITNYSRLPVRRLQLVVRLPAEVDVRPVRDALLAAVRATPLVLVEPPPEVRLRDLDSNGVTLLVRTWHEPDAFPDGRDAVVLAIQGTLRAGHTLPVVPSYAVWRRDEPSSEAPPPAPAAG